MKFYANQIPNIISAINNNIIDSLLIYGPDSGLIDFSLKEIAKLLKLPIKSLNYSDISDTELQGHLNNLSLFQSREIIRIYDIATFDSSLKSIVKGKHNNFLIVTALELSPSSSLRKTYDTEKNLGSIACYHDDNESVEKIIKKILIENNKNISTEALKYISHKLYGDRYTILNELDKLILYCNDISQITLKEAEAIISDNIYSEPDLLCIYFFTQDYNKYLIELNKLLAENIAATWIIRALVRYGINIYSVLQKTADGMSKEDAIASLSPAIFFKNIPYFKKALENFPKDKIIQLLEILYLAEIKAKSNIVSDKLICEEIMFEMNLIKPNH